MTSPSGATPAPSGSAGGSSNDPIVLGLQAVLAAQHAAVYGYSLIGVRLDDPGQVSLVRSVQAGHRDSRDAIMQSLAGRNATPVTAQPSYRPTEAVTDAVGAQRWALELEDGCAAGYRYLLVQTVAAGAAGVAFRSVALGGLATAAKTATRWRALLTPTSPTDPFPGTS